MTLAYEKRNPPQSPFFYVLAYLWISNNNTWKLRRFYAKYFVDIITPFCSVQPDKKDVTILVALVEPSICHSLELLFLIL